MILTGFMKRILVVLLVLLVQISPAFSEGDGYYVAERAPHSRLWQKVTLSTNESGVNRATTNAYTELRSGLCHEEKRGFS